MFGTIVPEYEFNIYEFNYMSNTYNFLNVNEVYYRLYEFKVRVSELYSLLFSLTCKAHDSQRIPPQRS